jgi:O-acetyl-ADP-ribose deacetylase (regulator of RNase III)
MITELKTDLLKAEVDAIGHCANCFNTMGSGIAKQIKAKFPEAFLADSKTTAGDRTKFGNFSVGLVSPENKTSPTIKLVYNLYGQYYYGKDSRKLNYESIYTALIAMRHDCVSKPVRSIGFPKNMGCMLAGGAWSIVSSMIESVFNDGAFSVYICEYTQ